jgi:hypothetical protein
LLLQKQRMAVSCSWEKKRRWHVELSKASKIAG